jgi:flagellar protein FlaG
MAIEPIKRQMQFQDVPKPSIKTKESVSTVEFTELKPIQAPVQGSAAGTTDNAGAEEEQSQSLPEARIKSAVKHANTQMKHAKTRCEFSYHEQTKRVSIKVIDKDTQEVIREIPPEETLDMVEKMWELAGILVDEKR